MPVTVTAPGADENSLFSYQKTGTGPTIGYANPSGNVQQNGSNGIRVDPNSAPPYNIYFIAQPTTMTAAAPFALPANLIYIGSDIPIVSPFQPVAIYNEGAGYYRVRFNQPITVPSPGATEENFKGFSPTTNIGSYCAFVTQVDSHTLSFANGESDADADIFLFDGPPTTFTPTNVPIAAPLNVIPF